MRRSTRIGLGFMLCGFAGAALAVLPPPTAAQVQAQAAKKAIADAQAESDKQHLLAKMDALSGAWRIKAGEQGWTLNAPTALAAPAAVALSAPASMTGGSGLSNGKAESKAESMTGSKSGAATANPGTAPATIDKPASAAPRADLKVAPSPPPASVKP